MNRPPHGHREQYFQQHLPCPRDPYPPTRPLNTRLAPLPSRFDQPPAESRSSRTLYDTYRHESRKRPSDNKAPPPPQDVRAATPINQATTPTQLYPCANCGGDHRATECDSLKCFTCQAPFPTAALRQTYYYMSTHRRDPTTKRARFVRISFYPRNQFITFPFPICL